MFCQASLTATACTHLFDAAPEQEWNLVDADALIEEDLIRIANDPSEIKAAEMWVGRYHGDIIKSPQLGAHL